MAAKKSIDQKFILEIIPKQNQIDNFNTEYWVHTKFWEGENRKIV